MELRQLNFFVGVADELHFGRAAERMYIAQPALSQHIRRLERELDVTLFNRARRRIRLTPAGEAFYDEARKVLGAAERAKTVARRAAQGDHGRLTIAVTLLACNPALFDLLRRLHAVAPGLSAELDVQDAVAIERGLCEGELAVGVLDGPVRIPGTRVRRLACEPLVALMAPAHPLADFAAVTIDALDSFPIVVTQRAVAPCLYDRLIALFNERSSSPRLIEARSAPNVALAAAGGAAVAVTTTSQAERWQRDVVFRPIVDPGASLDIVLVWRPDSVRPQLHRFLSATAEPWPDDMQPDAAWAAAGA